MDVCKDIHTEITKKADFSDSEYRASVFSQCNYEPTDEDMMLSDDEFIQFALMLGTDCDVTFDYIYSENREICDREEYKREWSKKFGFLPWDVNKQNAC